MTQPCLRHVTLHFLEETSSKSQRLPSQFHQQTPSRKDFPEPVMKTTCPAQNCFSVSGGACLCWSAKMCFPQCCDNGRDAWEPSWQDHKHSAAKEQLCLCQKRTHADSMRNEWLEKHHMKRGVLRGSGPPFPRSLGKHFQVQLGFKPPALAASWCLPCPHPPAY